MNILAWELDIWLENLLNKHNIEFNSDWSEVIYKS